jgi:two-component system response regulator
VSTQDLPALGLVVVLAEDNDDHALLIKMALEKVAEGGVEIHRARTGTEALALVRSLHPDLLLLDLRMPGMTGHEALEVIKGDAKMRQVPVAVLTSSDRDQDIAKSYGLGGNHFIVKPEDPSVLEVRVRTLLANVGEMGRMRRGPGWIPPTGESVLGPNVLFRRSLLNGLAVAVVLLLLLLFGFCTGAVG